MIKASISLLEPGEGFEVWSDSRLDNRGDLVRLLRLDPERTDDRGLLLSAWQKWGERCPEYLLGDFAFAVWDKQQRKLFLARDHVGVRPLYLYRDSCRVIFASDIRQLLAEPDVPRDINEEMLASYLLEIDQPGITFYKHICMLPAGSSLSLSPQGERSCEYWSPLRCPEVRYGSTDDYVDALDELLQRSVADRCRSEYPVAAHLSGGLDSSVVCAIAANNLAEQGRSLQAWSWLPPAENTAEAEHFEWANGRRIAEQYGIDYHFTDTDLTQYERIFGSHDIRNMDKLDFWNEHAVRDAVQTSGCRVVLSGWGGDELLSYNGGSSFYAELFWQGKRSEVLKAWWNWARRRRIPPVSMIKILWEQLGTPALSGSRFRSFYHGLAGSFYEGHKPLALLTEEAAQRIRDIQLKPRLPPDGYGRRVEQKGRFTLGSIQSRLESWSASAWDHGIEYRFPLLDKRLVEFALGIPLELYRDGTEVRQLFRRLSARYIPDDIAFSDTKFEHARADRHNTLMFNYLRSLAESRQPYAGNQYVDGEKLSRAIEEVSRAGLDLEDFDQLVRMMVIGKALLISQWR